MKYIQKGVEPPDLTDWKNNDKMYQNGNPKWNRFGLPAKSGTHAALLREQGGVCCYCGIGIELETSHIEHFCPKKFFPEIQLEYQNLLCSCQRELSKKEPKHCGNAKGSWFIEGVTVSPLDPNCETRFEYTEDGRIRAITDDEEARETSRRLNLDISKLIELRKAAIDGALKDVDLLQDKEIQASIDIYRQRSPGTNRFSPFCMAIIQCLERLL